MQRLMPRVEKEKQTFPDIHYSYQELNTAPTATTPARADVMNPKANLLAELESPSGTTVVHDPHTMAIFSSVAAKKESPSPVKSPLNSWEKITNAKDVGMPGMVCQMEQKIAGL